MPSQPVRRQGPADRVDRGRRPGRVLRAEAHLQRPVRRRPEQARGAVEHAPEGRGARRLLHRADRQGRDRAQGRAASRSSPTARWSTSARPPRAASASTPRSSTCARWCRSTSTRSARSVQEDRPLPDRARGDALLRLRRGAVGDDPGSSASGTSRRRSGASPAGTRRIRTRSSGSISPGPARVATGLKAVMETP